MPIKSEKINFSSIFERNSSLKTQIQFYLISGALITILLPPEYNNPFLILIGINGVLNKNLIRCLKESLTNKFVYLPLAFWALYLLSFFYSENAIVAQKEIEKMAAFGFFPLFIALGPKLDSNHIDKLKWHFIISISMLALYSLIISFSNMFVDGVFHFSWLELSYENLVSGIGVQPLYLSMFIALALFFLFEIQRIYKTGIAQILLLVLLFIYMMMLSTRMTTLAFFSIFALYNIVLALKKRNYVYQGITFLLFVIVAATMIIFNPINKKRFAEALNPNSNYQTDQYGGRSIRLEKWKCSIEVFKQSPILGVGVGDLQDELMKCYDSRSIDAALFHKFNSHNQYLGTLSQLGISGLILLLIILFFSFRKAIQQNHDVFLIFLILFSLCIISESMFGRRWGIFFFVFFYSIFNLYAKPASGDSLINYVKSKLKSYDGK